MGHEVSAGVILFHSQPRQEYLLLDYGSHWDFPKGHIEFGEAEKDAALREIKEETGLTELRLVNGFREEDVYQAVSNRGSYKGNTIEKHSVYFLCETKTMNIVVDAAEITYHKWLGMVEAEKLLIFDSLKRILRKAEGFAQAKVLDS